MKEDLIDGIWLYTTASALGGVLLQSFRCRYRVLSRFGSSVYISGHLYIGAGLYDVHDCTICDSVL